MHSSGAPKSTPVFSELRVAHPCIVFVVLYRHCLSLFVHSIFFPSLNCGFLLPPVVHYAFHLRRQFHVYTKIALDIVISLT